MTILIINSYTYNDQETGVPLGRHCNFIINDGLAGLWYRYSKAGLPLSGAILPMLEVEEAQLYAEAVANGLLATGEEIAQAQSRAWFTANAGAVTAIFGSTVEAQNTAITNLVAAMFPSATVVQRTQMRYALMAGLLTCRCYANGEGLV